jgi:hypothetical protein
MASPGGTGYRFQGVELNSSASWTSPIAFQELELATQLLLHTYRIRVNRNCGLQFHVGNGPKPLNTQTVKRVAALLWCLDPIICHIHPPQRRRMLHTLPIRENSTFACGEQTFLSLSNDMFFSEGNIGKPKLGVSVPIIPSRLSRSRRFPSSRLATSRADPDAQAELEAEYPDGFDGDGLVDIGDKDVDSVLDGVWRFIACPDTAELTDLIELAPGRRVKPNYSFSGYRTDQNADGQDEWDCKVDSSYKLTIEFREAVGSLDAEWISAWGRICAGIVLFAQNASTADFFGMALRLAQAQGDFGDPGPAPYDFIDFLDDIGCFAEAEFLEIKMQDKQLFWYPCKKLVFAAADMEPPWNPPSPPAEVQEFWDPPSPPPGESSTQPPSDQFWSSQYSSNQSSSSKPSRWLWGGTRPTSDDMDPQEKKDATESGKEESADATQAESGAPEQETTTEPEIETVSRGTETTPEERDAADKKATARQAADREAARVAASEREAREAHSIRFPHGHKTIHVSADELLCGPRALIESLTAQEPLLFNNPPTVEQLQELLDKADFIYLDRRGDVTTEKNRNDYTIDQLAVMLNTWGQEQDQKLNLRLGVVRPQKAPFLLPVIEPHGQIIIWVWNDDAHDEELGVIGHYQGLRPLGPPVTGKAPSAQAAIQFPPVKIPGLNLAAANDGTATDGTARQEEEEEEL